MKNCLISLQKLSLNRQFDKVLKEIELGIIDLRFNKKSDIDIAVIRLIEEASIKLATARELNIISSSYVKKEVIEEVKVKKETVKTFKKTVTQI